MVSINDPMDRILKALGIQRQTLSANVSINDPMDRILKVKPCAVSGRLLSWRFNQRSDG